MICSQRHYVRIGCIVLATSVATPTYAYKKIGWDWSYQSSPVEKSFIFCGNGAPAGAGAVIKAAAAKWNYAKFKFIFAADSCSGVPSDNYIDFGTLSDPGITAENSHPNEMGTVRMKKCSIRFNAAKSWNVSDAAPSSSQNDLMSVALHEFGHCVGLDDVKMSGVVMSGILMPGEMLRALTPDDVAGRNSIYGP